MYRSMKNSSSPVLVIFSPGASLTKQLGHHELLVSGTEIPLHRQHGLPQRLQESQVGEKRGEE